MIVVVFFMHRPGDIVGPFKDEKEASDYLTKIGYTECTFGDLTFWRSEYYYPYALIQGLKLPVK